MKIKIGDDICVLTLQQGEGIHKEIVQHTISAHPEVDTWENLCQHVRNHFPGWKLVGVTWPKYWENHYETDHAGYCRR